MLALSIKADHRLINAGMETDASREREVTPLAKNRRHLPPLVVL
jgi:hypothetical protein